MDKYLEKLDELADLSDRKGHCLHIKDKIVIQLLLVMCLMVHRILGTVKK